jgi:hypothetical protein
MKAVLISLSILSLFLVSLSCKGPEGPMGPVGPAGPAGPTGSGGESLIDSTILPKIFATYPPDGGQGPFDDQQFKQVQIRFNKIMDPLTVKHALSVSSSTGGVRIDTVNFSNYGGDIYMFYIRDSLLPSYYFHQWQVGEVCTVRVDSTARDINGNYLKPGYSMSFTPEPFFRVKNIYPANGSTGISTTSFNLSVTFNSKVDNSILTSIQSTPALSASWYAYDFESDSLTMYCYLGPSERVANNTTYRITITKNAHDRKGHYLQQEFVSSFTTIPFKINATYPYNGGAYVALNIGTIDISFTSPIDSGSVRQAFSISPDIHGSLTLSSNSSSFSYVTNGMLKQNTKYSITITTILRSLDGDTLTAPYTLSFTTGQFSITGSNPQNFDAEVSRSIGIHVYSNGFLDTMSVSSSYSIAPAVAGKFEYSSDKKWFTFIPDSLLAAYTLYTVRISEALQTRAGDYLENPYMFRFTTGNQ